MAKVTVRLRYGVDYRSFKVEEERLLGFIEPRRVKPAKPLDFMVREALGNPIGYVRLREAVKPGVRVAILSEDNTRICPVRRILPHILAELRDAGVKRDDIEIVMALGTHRPMTEKELKDKLGEEVLEQYTVVNHMWRDPEELVELGRVGRDTVLRVNRHVVEADFKIGIGNIIPHRVSGYSGGAKIVQPGVCGAETVGETHWRSSFIPMEEILGVVENPVRREMEDIAARAGLNVVVNTVLNRDGEVVHVFYGDYVKAHRAGVEKADSIYKVEIPCKADIVVVDSYPADLDMWQAVKALFPAGLAVKRGGVIVFLTPCPEGVSGEHPEVEEFTYLPIPTVRKLVEEGVVKDLVAAAHIAMVREVLDKAKCIMVSDGLSRSRAYRLGFDYADSLQEAVDRALEEKPDGRILVMSMGASLAPKICDST